MTSISTSNATDGQTGDHRFLTLDAARALECNGCGDCCDSRRTDGYWTWGSLPAHQYRDLTGGEALIIPLERVGPVWRDRAPHVEDEAELSPTRFRCTAFRPTPEGEGLCGRHDQPRPPRCDEFPVGGATLERELTAHGEVALNTSAFPRCTWYRTVVVLEGDPRLGLPAPPALVEGGARLA